MSVLEMAQSGASSLPVLGQNGSWRRERNHTISSPFPLRQLREAGGQLREEEGAWVPTGCQGVPGATRLAWR